MTNRRDSGDNTGRNMILAIVLAVIVIYGFDVIFPAPKPEPSLETKIKTSAPVSAEASRNLASTNPAEIKPAAPESLQAKPLSIAKALMQDERIAILTPSIKGSLRLKGARIDDIVLTKYRETQEKDSPNITLFAPAGTDSPRYAEFGWLANKKGIELPSSSTPWTVVSKEKSLTPSSPLTLSWISPSGLKFTRTISVDDKYMFTVTEKIENTSASDISLSGYGLISKTGVPPDTGSFSYVSFEGPIAVMDNTLKETKYDDLIKDKEEKFTTPSGGWIGITDKYWLSALVFDQKAKDISGNFTYHDIGGKDIFQTDYVLSPMLIEAGQTQEITNRLFVGAKEINTLDAYADEYGITKFDLAIDFGWYYFLTKPFLYILDFFNNILGNMGLAILLFAFLLRVAVFPIATKSYVSMHKMKLLQPKIKDLSEQYKNDKQRLSQEMMALYRREKVNPASGCLPALIQIPIFFSLYKVLYIAIELRQAPFYGWIHDLSIPDPTSVLTLFGLIDWPVPDFLNIGVWPLIMGITMYIQFKLNPTPADKTQAAIFAWMPIIFTFMLAHFAAGLVIYWAWSNMLSIAQQRIIIHRMDKRIKAEHLKLKDIT